MQRLKLSTKLISNYVGLFCGITFVQKVDGTYLVSITSFTFPFFSTSLIPSPFQNVSQLRHVYRSMDKLNNKYGCTIDPLLCIYALPVAAC